jgi:hypothetical protein
MLRFACRIVRDCPALLCPNSVSSATTQPGSGVATTTVAEPAADAPVPLKQIDMRAIESACGAKLESGVYLVDQNDFNCVDSGCSLEAMTGAGNPAVYDVEELPEADQLCRSEHEGRIPRNHRLPERMRKPQGRDR